MITYRDAQPEDLPFIYATWLKGLRHGNEQFGLIEKTAFFEHYHKIIELYLSKAQVKVACLVEDADVVLGYSVVRGTSLDWVFVKKSWRKMGIARALVPANIATVSHLTKVGQALKKKEWGYNPFI